jgi:hypothetical protein
MRVAGCEGDFSSSKVKDGRISWLNDVRVIGFERMWKKRRV